MGIQLRDYQDEAIDSIFNWWIDGKGDHPLVVAPTGSGKSLILSDFKRRVLDMDPSARMIMATHVQELVEQNYLECLKLWPDAPAGIYAAGLNRRQIHAQLVFGSIQSMVRKAELFGHVDILTIDEAHLVPRNSATMYGKFITALRETNPKLKIVGLTATPYRMDSGMLHKGDDAIFDGVCYDIDIKMLIDNGYLVPPITKPTVVKMDTTGVKKRGGEFTESSLDEAFNNDPMNEEIAAEIVRLGADRKAWLVFGVSVSHADAMASEIAKHGIETAVITGETPKAERSKLISDFREGRLRCLCGVNVLLTGFNAPIADFLAMVRPTESPAVWVQAVGRVLRTAPDKDTALIADFGRNALRHGPIDQINVVGKGETDGTGECPVKECPECLEYVHAAVRICTTEGCDHEFPPPKKDLDTRADGKAEIVSKLGGWTRVRGVEYVEHVSPHNPGRTPTLRAIYDIAGGKVSDFVSIQNSGYAREKAEQWWRRNRGQMPVPKTVNEAITRLPELANPTFVMVKKDNETGFRKVRGIRFDDPEAVA